MNIRSMPIAEAQRLALPTTPKLAQSARQKDTRYEARFCEFELSTRKFRVWDGGSLCTTCLREGE